MRRQLAIDGSWQGRCQGVLSPLLQQSQECSCQKGLGPLEEGSELSSSAPEPSLEGGVSVLVNVPFPSLWLSMTSHSRHL